MKSRIVTIILVLFTLSFLTLSFADNKEKADKKCDPKKCTSQSMKDCKDTSKCKMDKAQCEKTMGKAESKSNETPCPMMKGAKVSVKSTDGKMDCCKGKASKSSTKTKKATITKNGSGTN